MRNPLKVTLSLRAIPTAALDAFQDICRNIIVVGARRGIETAPPVLRRDITEPEAQRLQAHITTLQHARVPLKRVAVRP
jgi:hypothetical protein